MEEDVKIEFSMFLKLHMRRYMIETGMTIHNQCQVLAKNNIDAGMVSYYAFTGYSSTRRTLNSLFGIHGKMEPADYWGPHDHYKILEELNPGYNDCPWFVMSYIFGRTKQCEYFRCPKCGAFSDTMKVMNKKYVPLEEDLDKLPLANPNIGGKGNEILGCTCGEVWTWFQLDSIIIETNIDGLL